MQITKHSLSVTEITDYQCTPKATLKKHLNTAIFLLVGLPTTVLLHSVSAYASDEPPVFIIENASIEKVTDNNEFFHVHGHRITVGSGTVIAYRMIFNEENKIMDDEVYDKVTIFIPGKLKHETKLNKESGIIAIYTGGSSAFPEHGCFGYATNGIIKYNDKENKIDINIDFDVVNGVTIFDKSCKKKKFDIKNSTIKKMGTHELTPWIGCQGEHIYYETSPGTLPASTNCIKRKKSD